MHNGSKALCDMCETFIATIILSVICRPYYSLFTGHFCHHLALLPKAGDSRHVTPSDGNNTRPILL